MGCKGRPSRAQRKAQQGAGTQRLKNKCCDEKRRRRVKEVGPRVVCTPLAKI